MKPTNLRLQEFRDRDEFEIGINITDDEISEMAKELLILRKKNSLTVLKQGLLEETNRILKQQIETLIDKIIEYTDGGVSISDLMQEINIKTT